MAIEFTLTLSDDDLAAIGHAVVDPHTWAQHAFDKVGADAVRAKIAKYRDDYEAERARLGKDYKTRAERQAEEDAAQAAEQEQHDAEREAHLAAAREAEERRFNAAVAAAVEAHLSASKDAA